MGQVSGGFRQNKPPSIGIRVYLLPNASLDRFDLWVIGQLGHWAIVSRIGSLVSLLIVFHPSPFLSIYHFHYF